MGLLEHEECVCVHWSCDSKVSGVRVVRTKSGLEVADTVSASSSGTGVFTSAADCVSKLLTPSCQLIIAGGHLDGSICFDLAVPTMEEADIKQAITYELPRHIPSNPSDMVYGYRIIRDVNAASEGSKMLLRVFAVIKEDWNSLITELSASGIRIDAFFHPYQLLDPILSSHDEIYMPDIDPGFVSMRARETGSRKMTKIDGVHGSAFTPSPETIFGELGYAASAAPTEDLQHFIPVLMLAAYALSPDFADKHNVRVNLPPEIVPERFRMLRMSFFFLLAVFLILLAALGARNWWGSWTRIKSLTDEKTRVEELTKKIREQNNKLAQVDQMIAKLSDSDPGIPSLAPYIHELGRIVPKDAWLANLSTRGNTMDVNLRVSGDKGATLLSAFNNSRLFKTKNHTSRRATDGTQNLSLNLELQPLRHELPTIPMEPEEQ